jgi:hypothetical protein
MAASAPLQPSPPQVQPSGEEVLEIMQNRFPKEFEICVLIAQNRKMSTALAEKEES